MVILPFRWQIFTFNRTSMELKLELYPLDEALRITFNRTSMELKLKIFFLLTFSHFFLLIEPVWN